MLQSVLSLISCFTDLIKASDGVWMSVKHDYIHSDCAHLSGEVLLVRRKSGIVIQFLLNCYRKNKIRYVPYGIMFKKVPFTVLLHSV